jgi:hypothetical protein
MDAMDVVRMVERNRARMRDRGSSSALDLDSSMVPDGENIAPTSVDRAMQHVAKESRAGDSPVAEEGIETGFQIGGVPEYDPPSGDQGSAAVAFDGTTYLVVWQDYRSGVYFIFGARVNSSGSILDPCGIAISTAANSGSPAVAFDGTRYLVAWPDYRSGSSNSNIYGARVSKDGALLDASGFAISTAAGEQSYPAIAFDGTNYFVVWRDYRSGTNYDVYGARVSVGGNVLDAEGIAISTAANEQGYPSVVFDGINYFAVWQDKRGGSNYDIYGARVSVGGSVLDAGGIGISTAVNEQSYPTIAFDGTNHFVVWQDKRGGSNYDIYGARVSVGGSVLDGGGVAISMAANDQKLPAVAFDGTNYLVVWTDYRNGSNSADIYGTRVSISGTVLDPDGIAICTAASYQGDPSVAFGGTNYLVVWTDRRNFWVSYDDVYGARVSVDGTVLDAQGIVISTQAYNQSEPAVAFDGTNYFVVWYDLRSGSYDDIYGARVSTNGSVLDLSGIAISTAAYYQMYPAIAFDGTNYLVVWADWRSSYAGYPDIYGARVSKSGVVLDPSGRAISTAEDDQRQPALAFDGTNYLAVWYDWRGFSGYPEIYGARINKSGSVLDPSGIEICSAWNRQYFPAVAFDGSNYLVVWQDYRSGTNYDIYGTRLTPGGSVLDPAGIAISTATNDQVYPALGRGNFGSILVAYSSFVATAPYGSYRAWGNLWNTCGEPIPGQPSNLTARTASVSEIALTWTDNSSSESCFEIWRKAGPEGLWGIVASLPANTVSWSNTCLAPGTTYYYRARACNGAGCSGWSNTATATTGTIPAAPSNLVAVLDQLSRVGLSWNRNSTNEAGFRIERKLGVDGTWSQIASPGANSGSYEDCDCVPGLNYYYRVCAYNSSGTSAFSNEVNVFIDPFGTFFSGNVHVSLGPVNQEGAEVYIDYSDDRGGSGWHYLGTTVAGGSLSADIQFREGDEMRAVKKDVVSQEAARHKEVEPVMWELWMDSDVMGPDGNYSSAVRVSSPFGGRQVFDLPLVHPIFRYNLVVSGPFDDSDPYWAKLDTAFVRASKYLYDVTDGYVMLGKVTCLGNSGHLYDADVVIDEADGQPVSALNGIRNTQCILTCGCGQMSLHRMIFGSLPGDDEVYHRAIAHEFGHYALVLLDEYKDGNQNQSSFDALRLLDFAHSTYPETYGFMDRKEKILITTEQSSSNEYPPVPRIPGFPQLNTWQIWKWKKPCWEWVKDLLENDAKGQGQDIDIVPPLPGHYPYSRLEHHQRLGPTTCPYETQVQTPYPGELVYTSEMTGDLAETSHESLHELNVFEGDHPLAGASVYRRSQVGLTFAGTTDARGRVEIVGPNSGEHVAIARRGSVGATLDELPAPARTSSYTLEPNLPVVSSTQASLSDTRAPGAAVDVKVHGTVAEPALELEIRPDELLSSLPSVTYLYGSHSGQLPIAKDPQRELYSGTLAIAMTDSLFDGSGTFEVQLTDTASNMSDFVTEFKLISVLEGGVTTLEFRDISVGIIGDVSSTQLGVVAASGTVPYWSVGDAMTPVADVFSVHLAENDVFPVGGTANVIYSNEELHGQDETSLALFKWSADSLRWIPAESSLVSASSDVVSAPVSSGGVYCVFATKSSTDSLLPGRIGDLGAATGQGQGAVELEWTATGDDSISGTAMEYLLAFYDSTIADSAWATLPKIFGLGIPETGGSRELRAVALPLAGHTYYLAIRAKDEAGNLGPISNVTYAVSGVSDPNFLPGAPGNFRAVDAPADSGRAISLTWSRSYDDSTGKATVSRYKIYRSPAEQYAFALIDSVPAGTLAYLDSLGVTLGQNYNYRVSAADSIHETYSHENKAEAAINVGVPVCDFTSDAVVGLDDFSDFVDTYAVDSTYAEFEPLFDLNHDGQIYSVDFDSVETHFGEGGVPLPDTIASNASTNVMYRWVHTEGTTWHLNVICTSATDLAGYSFSVSYDGGSMTLTGVTPDSAGTGNNMLNSRGGLTPLFIVREDSSAVTIANVIKGPSNYTSATGRGFLANLIFNCISPGPTSVGDVVLMDGGKRLNVMGQAVAVPTAPPAPPRYALYQNYPNPFNPVTTIKFDLPAASKATLRVFDVTGRMVKTLVDRPLDAGQHVAVWNGRSEADRTVASGVYFYRLEAGKYRATRKMVLLR